MPDRLYTSQQNLENLIGVLDLVKKPGNHKLRIEMYHVHQLNMCSHASLENKKMVQNISKIHNFLFYNVTEWPGCKILYDKLGFASRDPSVRDVTTRF